MSNDSVASLLRRNVFTVDMDATADDVERIFLERHLSWAPVVDGGGAAVGVVSAADLLRLHADGRDARAVRAWQLCSYRPVSVDPTTPLREVAKRMIEQDVHHVIVRGDDGIAGVVSALDFVRWVAAA